MRVSVLGELSGAIAHEVNQPLTAILSNAQAALYLLGRDAPDLAEVRAALLDIVEEDNRAGEVILRLRGLLKNGEIKSEPVDINQLVDLTITLLRSEFIDRRVDGRSQPGGRPSHDPRRFRSIAASTAKSHHKRNGCNDLYTRSSTAHQYSYQRDIGRSH